jgi:hypothetical protein
MRIPEQRPGTDLPLLRRWAFLAAGFFILLLFNSLGSAV